MIELLIRCTNSLEIAAPRFAHTGKIQVEEEPLTDSHVALSADQVM
jgi:hypothetical protein